MFISDIFGLEKSRKVLQSRKTLVFGLAICKTQNLQDFGRSKYNYIWQFACAPIVMLLFINFKLSMRRSKCVGRGESVRLKAS